MLDKLEHDLKVQWKTVAGYGFLFVVLFFIFTKAPLISDDFEFADYGFTSLSQAIPYVLYYGNGRFLGNLSVVVLINYPVICALVKAAIVCCIIYAVPRAVGFSARSGYGVMAALTVVLMNPNIFGQVYTWTSGFMNYVPPVLAMLLCLGLVRNSTRRSVGRMVAIAVIGLAGQLFVEHATVIHILLAALLLVSYHHKKDSLHSEYALCWLLAGIVGACIMFAIPRIFYIEDNRTDGYRVLHLADMIAYSLKSAVFIMNTVSKSTILLALMSLLGLLLQKCGKKSKVKTFWYITYPIVSALFSVIDSSHGFLQVARYLLVYVGFIPYALFLASDIWTLAEKNARMEMLVYMILAALSVLPFLVISPFGERCLYLCYVLLSLMLFRGLRHMKDSGLLTIRISHRRICAALIVVCSIFLCCEFAQIQRYNKLRDSYIKEQIALGKTEITVFNIPSRYAFQTYLLNHYYYHEERGDIKFTVVEYEEWEKITSSD